jgi:hypothetical protein
MKAIRATIHTLCLTAALGGVALASTATQPATNPQNTESFRHELHGGPGDLRPGHTQQLHAAHQSGRATRDQLKVTPPTNPAYAGMLASAKLNAADQIRLMSDLWTQVYAKLTPDQSRASSPRLESGTGLDGCIRW